MKSSTTKLLLLLATLITFGCQQNENDKKNDDVVRIFQAASVDKSALEKAMQTAEQEQKLLVLKVGAAWCGPCMDIDEDIVANAKDMVELQKKIEFVGIEYTHRHSSSGFIDYLPHNSLSFVPSLYLYDPKIQKWIQMRAATFADIRNGVVQYQKQGNLSQQAYEEFMAVMQGRIDGTTFTHGTKPNLDLQSVLISGGYELSKTQNLNILSGLKKVSQTNKDYLPYYIDSSVALLLKGMLNRGQISANEAKNLYSEIFDLDPYTVAQIDFVAKLAEKTKTGAPISCAKIRENFIAANGQKMNKRIEQKMKSLKEKMVQAKKLNDKNLREKQVTDLQNSMDDLADSWNSQLRTTLVSCEMLNARLGTNTIESFESVVKDLASYKNKSPADYAKIYALLGDFDKALEYYTPAGKIGFTNRIANYKQSLKDLNAKIEEEKDSASIEEMDKMLQLQTNLENGIERSTKLLDRINKAGEELRQTWRTNTTSVKSAKTGYKQ